MSILSTFVGFAGISFANGEETSKGKRPVLVFAIASAFGAMVRSMGMVPKSVAVAGLGLSL